MDFFTHITFSDAPFLFSLSEPILLLGSCFVENMGKRLEDNKFQIDLNPFGTLYNPASIAETLRMLLHPERFTENNLFLHEGIYHSFSHHSRFSSSSAEDCLKNINDRLFLSAERLRQEQRLIVTWGTAWAYRLKSSGEIVANCHKLPDKLFERELLSVRQIVTEWKELLLSLWEQNPELRILFTISPIRHWKDGAHGNQISKATLLLAVHELEQTFPEHIAYFPAYEIMMDELRDYRFYADDMLHPSEQAVEYIWETFARHLFTQETKKILQAWSHIQKALQHKPFHPESETYKQFLSQTLLKMERLTEKFPYFDLEKEITKIKETSSNNMFQP